MSQVCLVSRSLARVKRDKLPTDDQATVSAFRADLLRLHNFGSHFVAERGVQFDVFGQPLRVSHEAALPPFRCQFRAGRALKFGQSRHWLIYSAGRFFDRQHGLEMKVSHAPLQIR